MSTPFHPTEGADEPSGSADALCASYRCLQYFCQFDPIGIVPLTLGGTVVAVLALCALQSDTNTHPEASSTINLEKVTLLNFITGRYILSTTAPNGTRTLTQTSPSTPPGRRIAA